MSGKCHEALAEHIKGEENEKENAEWAALIEWMKIGHRSELDILAKDHAAKVVQLQKERSEVRRSLELRNRELRATKREMRELKKSIGEAVKSQEEKQPAPDLHQADVSDTESVDEDEGGVLLAQDNAVLTNKVCDKSEKTGDAPQKFEEAEPCMRIANEGTKEVKISKKETIAEKKKLQQALRQKLIDDSTPEALLEAEAGPSAAKQKTTAIRHQNKAPLTEVKDLQDHNKALQANLVFTRDVIHNMGVEAEARDEEVKNLKAQNHFAQLEVGHCHAANACYRAAAEDDNPARTAHLDGLLKRKDEAFADLEERAAECAELLAEEKKERAIEKAHSDAEIRGMHKELAHRFKVIKGLTEGRDILKAQNDWVFQMFQGKISHDDVIEAFLRDYLVIQSDNTLLIKMIKERQCFILDAEKQLADLKAEKIINDHAAHADYLKHRQTQQSLNGLTYVNNQLNAKIEFQNDTREELREEMQGQINQQAADIQQFLESGTEDWLIRRQQAQERQIDFLNAELTTANGVANQWRIRALEQQDAFCPLNDFAEVGDWNAEETRWRLREAERQVVELQQVVREMNRERKGKGREKGKGKEKGVWEIGHDGSNWLRDRAEAERVREEFRWVE